MFKKMKSKKFKVAVVVLLCTLAVSTTAVAASFQLLKFHEGTSTTVQTQLTGTGNIEKVITDAKGLISKLQGAVTARSAERDAALSSANSTISTANAKIDNIAASASSLESDAKTAQSQVDQVGNNTDTTAASSIEPVDSLSSNASSN